MNDEYMDLALDERTSDFGVVRDWVFHEIEHNLPQFAHDLACMLAGAPGPYAPDYDYRRADAASVDALRGRMGEAIAAQPETLALAAHLEEDAERAEREAEEDERQFGDWYGNPYLEACHDDAVRAARRAQARLDEYEREHA